VLLLGVTYKPDIADQRESPAVPLAQALIAKGANVDYFDPYVDEWNLEGERITRVSSLDDAIDSADIVVLVQNHSSFDVDSLVERAKLFFDTRGVASGAAHRL
jgi:UDP-N-acetyl-D-glucosamine dehydrogenase